jgi:hypothetical protein
MSRARLDVRCVYLPLTSDNLLETASFRILDGQCDRVVRHKRVALIVEHHAWLRSTLISVFEEMGVCRGSGVKWRRRPSARH